jgi:ribosomal protein S18 acetylase RimI-like enzyme
MARAVAGPAPPPFLVREADFDDAAGIADVHVRTWRAAYRDLLPAAYLDTMSDIRHAAMWADVLDQTDRIGVTLIAEAEKAGIVGFADCSRERGIQAGDRGEITALYVLPEWQGRGIGRALVRAAARALAAGGMTQLAIWVLQENARARAFYAHIGGRLAETRRSGFLGLDLTEVCYRWPDVTQLLA